mmetsp:Transcript_18408/g.56030  ORF Transcript_18408/g.56030 Transcript_18408/m.56030 type:complete len:217 (-) Transcript_18408:56-706(-)
MRHHRGEALANSHPREEILVRGERSLVVRRHPGDVAPPRDALCEERAGRGRDLSVLLARLGDGRKRMGAAPSLLVNHGGFVDDQRVHLDVPDVVRAEPLVVVEAVADAVDVSVVSNSAGCSRGAAQCDWMPGAARRAQHAALDRAHVAAYHVSAAPTIGNGKQRAAENPKTHDHQLPRRRRREEDGLAETALGVAALARPCRATASTKRCILDSQI